MWKEETVTFVRNYPCIRLEALRKMRILNHNEWFPCQDLRPGPLKYEREC